MEMIKSRYLSLLLLAAPAFQSWAQYDQDINVEGKYVPEFIPQDRIGVFPRPVRFSLEKSTLDYSLTGVHADFTPQAIPVPVTGWKDTRRWSDSRGYLELGLGSWLESTLSAGYRIIDNRKTVLGLRLQHNSTSLWKPDLAPSVADTRMWRYDEAIGIYASHLFDGKGRLDAAVDYHIGNFNYYGYNPFGYDITSSEKSASAPTQTLNDISARVSWNSAAALDDISWNAAAGIRCFGYRRLYLPGTAGTPEALTGARETHVDIDGGIVFPTSAKSSIGIDLATDILSYGDYEARGTYPADGWVPDTPDTYAMLSLTPFYRFTRSRLDIRIGAKVDLTFNAGPETDRYNVFHIAPSVKLDYNAGPATIFLHLTGGNELHTLAGDYELDYYQMPGLFETAPVYSPLDARLGFSFGPFSGFHAGFDVAYRTSRGQYFGGMYMPFLNDDATLGDMPEVSDGRPVSYEPAPDGKSNLSGFSVGLQAGYDAGRYFSISAEGRYQPQNGTTGYFNGFDRPRWTADATLETNPWSSLKFRLGVNYRGVRGYSVHAWYADSTPLNSDLIMTKRIPDLIMLNLGASYSITENFDIWLQADNLMNRENIYAPGLPEPGIRLSAGIGVRF